jgi:hypothetical protein
MSWATILAGVNTPCPVTVYTHFHQRTRDS